MGWSNILERFCVLANKASDFKVSGRAGLQKPGVSWEPLVMNRLNVLLIQKPSGFDLGHEADANTEEVLCMLASPC